MTGDGLPDGLGVLLDDALARAGLSVWAADDEDHDFAIRHWSPGAERQYGYTAAEALGQNYLDLFVRPDGRQRALEDHRRLLAAPDTATGWRTIATDIGADGSPVPVFHNAFPLFWRVYGRHLLVEVSLRLPPDPVLDHRPPSPNEPAVVTSADHIDDLVDDALRMGVSETYRTIVPLLVHRAGNPTDTIVREAGHIIDLVQDATHVPAAEVRDGVARIADAGDRIARLLADLDQLSEGVPPLRPLDLHQVVESTKVATLTREFRYIDLDNRVEPGLVWNTHELLLREVLTTLTVNACEAILRRAGGGDVRVSAHIDPAYGHLVINVDDNGPGLNQDLLVPRPGRVRRWRRRSTKGGRHGRGLVYAEQALDMLGGRLDLSMEPSPLGGARVTIVLEPVAPTAGRR